jgi:hypothetical protein
MRLKAFLSNGKPHRVYKLRYENPNYLRENGKPHFRVITVPVGWGRFERGTEAAALELAERRLSEAYGAIAYQREAGIREGTHGSFPAIPGYVDPAVEKIRHLPDAHQDNYQLVEVRRVK